jgi:hypothetical protein
MALDKIDIQAETFRAKNMGEKNMGVKREKMQDAPQVTFMGALVQ